MYLLLAFALFIRVLATVPLSSVQRTTSTRLVPHRFVVELDNIASLPPSKRSQSAHETFYSTLAKRTGGNFKIDREFNVPNVFVGASITVSGDDAQTLAQLAQIPGVKAIRPVIQVPRPDPVDQIIPTGPNDPSIPPDRESTHVMTGVDKLHAQGIFGKGIKIGILDTGTDYTHPFLGGGFGPGFKVAGGFDFVGDAYNGANTPVPGPNPLDQCAGHGTHVAGIIGANPGNPFNISGVAFESTLFSYRIFGCTGFVTDDIIIEALLRGLSEGMDIMTLSLGGADGWTEGASSVVASRIAELGKVITIAAGNDGAVGSWFTSGPGNGINVVSVAAVDNTVLPVQNAFTSDSTHPTITYFSANPLPINGSLPIFATSNDTTIVNDACNPLPASTPDLSNFLVIVRRGTCTFVTKLQNIANKGAKVSLIYDNGNGFNAISTGKFTSALIQAADGQFLVDKFVSGAPITISFPQVGGATSIPNPTGGLVSSFSSYGPSYDFFFKPAIAAPGGSIISTFPVPLGSFAVLSGTSMATPFLAGSSALLLQTKGTDAAVALGARTRFQTTAQSIPSDNTGGGLLQTLTQQGAGLVNAFNALQFDTVVTPGELILNDTENFVGSHVITIQNTGSVPQNYKLSHVPAGTAVTIQPGTIFPSPGRVPLTSDFAAIHFSDETVTVGPHGTAKVEVTISPPDGVDRTTFPVYTGFVQIQSIPGGEILHVAYQGVAAALRDLTVLDNTDTFFGPGVTLPTVLDAAGNIQVNATNYTFVGADIPTLLFRLASGTPRLLVDLVDPNLSLTEGDLLRRELPSDFTPLDDHRGGGSFSRVPTIGPLAEFDFQPRSSNSGGGAFNTLSLTTPTFANNSVIPNGQYRVLMRALKITGDPTVEKDFETFLSPIIGVNVA